MYIIQVSKVVSRGNANTGIEPSFEWVDAPEYGIHKKSVDAKNVFLNEVNRVVISSTEKHINWIFKEYNRCFGLISHNKSVKLKSVKKGYYNESK